LLEDVGRRRLVRYKVQLQILYDPVHDRILREEGDDLHHAPAVRTEEWVNFINLADHLGPALGRNALQVFLDHPERRRIQTRLLDLASMGIGVKAIITHRDLALVRDVRGHPGNEFQIVHPLQLFGLFPIPVADPAFLFINRESFQGKQ
jgi:hypothetical protein